MTIAAITINKYELTTTNADGEITTQTIWAMPTAVPEYITKYKLDGATYKVIAEGIQQGEEITEEQKELMREG